MKKLHIKHIKKTGFKVPENYFEDFEDILLSELKLKETISKSGFAVPQNYFESLEQRINDTIKKDKEVKVIKLFTWRKALFTASIAASLILMFNVLYNKKEIVSMNTIETVSIENYILTEDLESNEIASLFSNDDLSDLNLNNMSFNSETLENYVIDNLEIEDIITK